MDRGSAEAVRPLLNPVYRLGPIRPEMERETPVGTPGVPIAGTYNYDGDLPSAVRTSTAIAGAVVFILGLFGLIFVLVYTSGNAGPYIPLAFNVPISSGMPGQSGGSSVWNLLLAFTVILVVTGIIHLFVLMRECWYPVIDGIFGRGINPFRGMIFFFVHPALVFAVAQIVNVQDWSVLVALVFLAFGFAGDIFMFELYNASFLKRILYFQIAVKERKAEDAAIIREGALDATGTWLPYIMAWTLFVPIWTIIWIYAIFTLSSLASNDIRFWVVLSVPLVVSVLTIFKLVLTGVRYSRVRGWLQYTCGGIDTFEIIDTWIGSVVIPMLFPAVAMFIVSLE